MSALPDCLLAVKSGPTESSERILGEPFEPRSYFDDDYPVRTVITPVSLQDLVTQGKVRRSELISDLKIPAGQRIREESHVECDFVSNTSSPLLVAILEDGSKLYRVEYKCNKIVKTFWVHSPADLLVETATYLEFYVYRFVVICPDGSVLILADTETVDSGLDYAPGKDLQVGDNCPKCVRPSPVRWAPPFYQPTENPRQAFSIQETGQAGLLKEYLIYRDTMWRYVPPLRYVNRCEVIAEYEMVVRVSKIAVDGSYEHTWYEDFVPRTVKQERYRIPGCEEIARERTLYPG